jgi:prepilin-type N-terminal cleavage/methylation domain-containing protein
MKKQSNIKYRISQTDGGYTLLELIITLTVLAILVMGTIPLAQNAVKRQKELRLRETLREIRSAIDEFKRDTLGACPQGAVTSTNPIGRPDKFRYLTRAAASSLTIARFSIRKISTASRRV